MWFRPNKYEAFEQWCDEIKELPLGEGLNFAKYGKDEQRTPERRGALVHKAVMKLIDADEERRGNISINHPDWQNRAFEIDLSSQADREGITPSTRPDLLDLSTGPLGELRMVSANVRRLQLGAHTRSANLTNCRIGTLFLPINFGGDIDLRNCWIGRLELGKGSVRNISVEGGTVRSLSCPSTADSNPITGSAAFLDVDFATDLKPGWRKNAQPYRNLRKHLENLEDIPNANLMRTLELATERHTDRGFNKIWNYAWGWCANYGYSPGRPLWWVLGLYLVTALGLWIWDGGVLTQDASAYPGWEDWFTCNDWFRAAYLPLRPIISPLGALGGGTPVDAATLGGKIALVLQGIATYLLIGMTVVGVRKRFKLH